MYVITIGVNKQRGTGADHFFEQIESIMAAAETWELVSSNHREAIIVSKATSYSLPEPPRWKLSASIYAGSITAHLQNDNFDEKQHADAIKYLVYLCLVPLAPVVNKIEILHGDA